MNFIVFFSFLNSNSNRKALLLGENGWLNRRLNYVKSRLKSIAAAELPANDIPTGSNESLPPNPNDDLENLKSTLIHKSSRDEIIRKLNSTRELRKIMLKQTETDLRHQFPFFFADPELVSIIFECTID